MAFDESLFEKFPIEVLKEPKNNHKVYMKKYWIVHEGSVLRYKKTKSWQCNGLKEIIQQVMNGNSIYDGCVIQYFEYLYVPS